jgi:small basic protein
VVPEGTPEKSVGGKAVLTALLVPTVYALDWVLVGLTAALVGGMVAAGAREWQIWLVLWALNLILSGAVILGGDRLGVDLTLMQGVRRLVDMAVRQSRAVGRTIEAAVTIRLLLWDGPDQLLIFMRPRCSSRTARAVLFIAAGGLQMLLWTRIYLLGLEGIGDLLRLFAR